MGRGMRTAVVVMGLNVEDFAGFGDTFTFDVGENVEFAEELAAVLRNYDLVVFAVLLTPATGEGLIYLYRSLEGVRKISFIALHQGIEAITSSREQINRLIGVEEKFEGVVISSEHLVGDIGNSDFVAVVSKELAKIAFEMLR